ncbi:MAG: cyclic nucleotide-binding domain-containing protein [Gammaproteobacteria bacterium]|nr:cyclic nucleotide-binding domain-containing protein [Gammaproteobacteria bacterium]
MSITSSKPIDPNSKSIYLVKDGIISETYEENVIVNYEEGDLIGVDGLIQRKLSTYKNDFAVTVDVYDGQQFLDEVLNSKEKFHIWNKYVSCLSQSYQLMMCHFSQQDISFSPEYRYFQEGDVIIEENTDGDEVFTLLTGAARVVLNNTEVGVINQDEIFGAIAALTNTKRTASIIASTDCETIVVKSDSFRSLLTARPDTVQKLIHDMARSIVSSNDRIMALSKRH